MKSNDKTGDKAKVTFTYVGTLEYRGRLLKQIATLQAAGHECRLIYGDRGERPLKREDYGFPIEVIQTPWKWGSLVYFLHQLRFGFVASRKIAVSDATHVVTFSLESLLAGTLAKRKRPDLKLIFDSNELHIEAYVNWMKKKLWAPIQKFCIRYCDVIMHAEGNRLEYFKKHHDPTGRKQFLLENFPKYIERVDIGLRPVSPPIRVLYMGGMGIERYTKELIDVFRELGSDYCFDLVGPKTPEFLEELESDLERNPALNVKVCDSIPYSQMGETIRKYHIGIALYKNNNLCNYYCAPNKVYDYLMSGVPVIANNYPGLLKVLEEGKLGVCIKEVDLENFRIALQRIVNECLWENITDEVRNKYSWEAQVPGYLALFK